nr:restriction endonuclease [Dechloromonas denitrificans]
MGQDKYLVQCKQWKVAKVGVATVRELYGVMTAERAVGGFVVASGEFTDDARSFAEGRSIQLVATLSLLSMIGNNASPSGTWRGQVQYQGTGAGGVVQEAMAVVPMTIDIDPQGKVKGSSPENGCSLKGIAAPGIMPVSVNLDVTFTGCHYKGLNRRFSGTLFVIQAQKYAQLSLNGSHVVVLGGATFFDVKGTMRR